MDNPTQATKHDESVVWLILGAFLLFFVFSAVILIGIF